MKYTSKTFSVPVEGDAYREGWERIFGKRQAEQKVAEDRWRAMAEGRPVLCGCGAPLMKDGFCHDCGKFSNGY